MQSSRKYFWLAATQYEPKLYEVATIVSNATIPILFTQPLEVRNMFIIISTGYVFLTKVFEKIPNTNLIFLQSARHELILIQ